MLRPPVPAVPPRQIRRPLNFTAAIALRLNARKLNIRILNTGSCDDARRRVKLRPRPHPRGRACGKKVTHVSCLPLMRKM